MSECHWKRKRKNCTLESDAEVSTISLKEGRGRGGQAFVRHSNSMSIPTHKKAINLERKIFCSFFVNGYYSAFHKTFDKRFPKFVWNSRSSPRTWQFHYVVLDQIANFETKLWISRRTSLGSCEVRAIRCSWFGNIITNESLHIARESNPKFCQAENYSKLVRRERAITNRKRAKITETNHCQHRW